MSTVKDRKIDISKVLGAALIGGTSAAGLIFSYQVMKIYQHNKHKLDPPAPNMQERNPHMVEQFEKFIGWFYRLCPEIYRDEYQKKIKTAISFAELVCVIENQLLHKEIKPITRDRIESKIYARICMINLREARNFFKTDIIMDITDSLDIISLSLANHLSNIRALTDV